MLRKIFSKSRDSKEKGEEDLRAVEKKRPWAPDFLLAQRNSFHFHDFRRFVFFKEIFQAFMKVEGSGLLKR